MADMARQLGWSVACICAAVSRGLGVPVNHVPVPTTAMVLGSTQGELVEKLDPGRHTVKIPYGQIYGFPESTVPGHEGALYIGLMEGEWVALLSGRAHFDEGNDADAVTHAVRTMMHWGVENLIVTNAAGSIVPNLKPGDIMVVDDHNAMFSGVHVCRGPVDPATSTTRFPAPAGVHMNWLRELALEICEEMFDKNDFGTGVYAMLPGPFYETASEVLCFQTLNALRQTRDVVSALGMSTTPEIRAAVAMGFKNLLVLSLITNRAGVEGIDHDMITHNVGDGRARMVALLAELVKRIGAKRRESEPVLPG